VASNDQLEYHDFSFLWLSPVCKESPQLGASRPYNDDHKRSTEVREGRATHTRLKSQNNHAHKSQLELKTQPTEFTTQMELKSLSQRIKCMKLESWRLRMFLECLEWLLHAPMGPFYSPKAARSRWRPTRKAKVAFCWVAHRTVTVDDPVRIYFLFLCRWPLQRRGSWRTGHCPVHTGQSRAPCRPLARATCRPRIARPTVALAAVGSPDSPVNYSRTLPNFSESVLFTGCQRGAPDTVWCTTGQSGVPDWAGLRLYTAKSLAILFFFSFLCF
jgi:hypothetical protein